MRMHNLSNTDLYDKGSIEIHPSMSGNSKKCISAIERALYKIEEAFEESELEQLGGEKNPLLLLKTRILLPGGTKKRANRNRIR
jgi:hypothetical protein